MRFCIIPLTLGEANRLVARWHRHHKPVVSHRFSLGLLASGVLVGAVIVGRPVARNVDYATTAEVTRLVTDGTPHSCSCLYAAAARVAREMGFDLIQTYILAEEPGTSLRAAGWTFDGLTTAGQWDHSGHKQLRLDAMKDGIPLANRADQPTGQKQRWVKRFA